MPNSKDEKLKMSEIINKENPHVHRYTSYITDLKTHWAYKDSSRCPKGKYIR